MSEREQMTQESGDTTGGTALKALAGAAAGGAATYAVRKALVTRNGHDDQNAEGDEGSAKGDTSDEQAENEPDDSEYAEEEDEDEPEGSADDDDLDDGDESDEDYDGQDAPEGSADEDDDYEDDDSAESNGADGSSGKGSLRQLVNPSRLASLSHLLVPLAAEAADSAGRYVAEHTSDTVQQQVVNRFIDAFERAS